jgi:protein-L-isoaspartate(D-aspartate) O-methyltransferase
MKSDFIEDPKVKRAMRRVPRADFLPDELKYLAGWDGPLPIGEEQTISQPSLVARMTEALHINEDSRVLEVGTGCGYQTAVLAEIAREVFTVEIRSKLSETAQETLKKLGYTNIYFKIGDGTEGWKEFAPFDAIIVTAAPPEIPQALLDQLKEGGTLIIPVGPSEETQELLSVKKNSEGIEKQILVPVRFVPMVHPR